jgi:FkbM family methyltransferase
MEIHLYKVFLRRSYRPTVFLLAMGFLSIVIYSSSIATAVTTFFRQTEKRIVLHVTSLSNHVDVIDLQKDSKDNFTCIKTKYLLHVVRTTICLHDTRDAVSNIILKDGIWEERFLIELFGFLMRYPEMSFIDVGANLGAYTMFAASFGKFVLAIECFKPNIERIRKAVQIEKVQDKVVLIGNAIFSESGKYLEMKSDPSNVGSQAIIVNSNMNNSHNGMYVVKTIRFDDILPVLKAKNIRNAVMKVDIQWSEVFLCETGGETFDYVNIPVVLMEWEIAPQNRDRMRNILKFFIGRGYVATTDMCKILNEGDAFNSWPGDIYWMKMNRSEIC